MKVDTVEIPVQIKLTKIDLGDMPNPDRFVDDLAGMAARESAATRVEPKPVKNEHPNT